MGDFTPNLSPYDTFQALDNDADTTLEMLPNGEIRVEGDVDPSSNVKTTAIRDTGDGEYKSNSKAVR